MPIKIEFNLDQILKARGLRVSQAARMCGIPYPVMYSISRNHQRQVSLGTLERLMAGLGVTTFELFRQVERPA